jgi:hypothetical protein
MLFITALFALSATTALASPWGAYTYTTDREVIVSLSNTRKEIGSRTAFIDGKAETKPPVGSSGPYTVVNIIVGKNAQKKDIRCKLLDNAGKEIKANRGENLDTTFSDAGKGEWKFQQETEVAKIVCDPAFKANNLNKPSTPTTGTGENIRVQLNNQQVAVQFNLKFSGARTELPIGAADEFNQVTIFSPASVKETLRCQIQDKGEKAIEGTRGANVDITFSDAGKGAWDFKMPAKSSVGKIVCDPAFKKRAA